MFKLANKKSVKLDSKKKKIKDSLRPMVSKEVKELKSMIKDQWGAEPELDYQFIISSKEKVYVVNRDIGKLDLEKFRINSAGLYFAEVKGELRLSIEGSQIIGPHGKKNVLELKENQVAAWFLGKDLNVAEQVKEGMSGFVILKCKNDFLGSGKFKDGLVYNFVSKARRFTSSDLP